MASPTNSVLLEAAAVESLVRMNSEQLDRDECDAASDVLFGILSGRSHQDPTPSGKVAGISSKSPTGGISIPLSSPEDADYLSPLQCYIRAHCVEYFEATESEGADSKSPSKNQQQRGRRTPIVVGRVGIRCVFCKDYPFNERASQSTAFPSNLDKIYSSVVMWQCRHLPQCREIPAGVKKQLGRLKRGHGGGVSSNGAHKNSIWARSAKEIGLFDTKDGIKYLPPSTDEETEVSVINESAAASDNSSSNALVIPKPIRPWVITPDEFVPISYESIDYKQLIRDSELVSLQDSGPAFLAISLAQYKRCYLSIEDQIGNYKSREIGSIGICCKWCGDEPGHHGRYFPNKCESLSQTSTVKSIVNHVCSCSKCPRQIKQAISSLADTNASYQIYIIGGHIGPNNGSGSKAQFIKTVWSRLQEVGLPKDAHLFRPIQESPDIDPIVEYESLKAKPLIDDKGRRVSVSLECLDDYNISLPSNKRSKDVD